MGARRRTRVGEYEKLALDFRSTSRPSVPIPKWSKPAPSGDRTETNQLEHANGRTNVVKAARQNGPRQRASHRENPSRRARDERDDRGVSSRERRGGRRWFDNGFVPIRTVLPVLQGE